MPLRVFDGCVLVSVCSKVVAGECTEFYPRNGEGKQAAIWSVVVLRDDGTWQKDGAQPYSADRFKCVFFAQCTQARLEYERNKIGQIDNS